MLLLILSQTPSQLASHLTEAQQPVPPSWRRLKNVLTGYKPKLSGCESRIKENLINFPLMADDTKEIMTISGKLMTNGYPKPNS